MVRVLFVCTGNICRSPSAEGVFRHLVRQAGLDDRIEIDSAGTHDYHVGEPPDPRTCAVARTRGFELDDLRARQVRASDFNDFDLILAMDQGHLDHLRRIAPSEARSRIGLFLDYAPERGRRDVPDPYYGEQTHFMETLDLIEAGAAGLLDRVRRDLG